MTAHSSTRPVTDLLSDVDRWCTENLPPRPRRRPLHLLNVRPTADELAAHPQSLATQAYFAGARYAAGERPQRFPRQLTADEAECWSDGYGEHLDTAPEVRSTAPASSARGPLLEILAIDPDLRYEHHGAPRRQGPELEAS